MPTHLPLICKVCGHYLSGIRLTDALAALRHKPPFTQRLAACSDPSGPEIKRNLRVEGHGIAFSLVDIPIGWDPRAKQQPTGLIAYQLTLAALFESLRS